MTLGIRGKLFLVSLALVVVVAAVSGVLLETFLRGWLEDRVEQDLERLVGVARTAVEAQPAPLAPAAVATLVERMGRAAGARYTVIAPGGGAVADSEPGAGQGVNYRRRPEVQAALARGLGFAQRRSERDGARTLFVAMPLRGAHVGAVVRGAVPLSAVDELIGRLRLAISAAVLLALAVAAAMGALASYFASRRLTSLVSHVRALSAGRGGDRLDLSSGDELGGLAGSFTHMAEEIDRAVRALGEERDRVEAILQSLEDAVFAVDAELRVTEMNRAGLELLGLSEEPRDTSLLELLRIPDLRDVVRKAQRGEPGQREVEWPGPPKRALLVSARPQRASDRCVVVLRDITNLRRLEHIRRQFVANVSHELRTPVSIIQANAETLLSGALSDPARARDFVEGIHRTAVRLSDLVSDILDLSRVEAGAVELRLAPISPAGPIGAVLDLLEPRAEARGLAFDIDVEEDVRCQADPRGLEQVLVNLVDNAIKYTPPGGRLGLRVRSVEGDETVRFEVWDTGPGVPERHRERLFERFYRVDPGRSRDMGGTGLGLSIVKHLVLAMGGAVGMEPREGGGSVFWITLRAAP